MELLCRGVFEDDPIGGIATFECDAFSAFEALRTVQTAVHAEQGGTGAEGGRKKKKSSLAGVRRMHQRADLQGQGYVKDDDELIAALQRMQRGAGAHAAGMQCCN
jgi:hypothetical protein